MDEIRELYQEVILDHNKNPCNFKKMENPDSVREGYNPLCGDHYTFYMKFDGDVIDEVSFEGSGCAISKASASIMSAELKGKTREQADRLFDLFIGIVTGKLEPFEHIDELGKLAAFAGVAEFPVRVKCATLPWHTMHGAMHGERKALTGEPGAMSGEPGAMSGEPGAMSGEPGAMSGEPGAVSGEPGAVSGEPGAVTTE